MLLRPYLLSAAIATAIAAGAIVRAKLCDGEELGFNLNVSDSNGV